ncbi:MAG TPA: hypothetical protein IAC20_04435 [Candidatus Faecisoma merdavium]|nr:hypothetical protein [Candidatus Faecisoma merdavium]
MKFISKMLAYICGILLFFAISFLILIYSGKSMLNKENLSNYIKSSNILNIDINVIFNLEESGMTLKEKIYNLGIESNIPEKIMEDILKSEEINIILGDFFNETIYYLIDEREKPQLSNDAVTKMLDLACASLEDHINIMMSEDDLKSYVLDFEEKLMDIVPERQVMIGVLPVSIIKSLLNFNTIYLVALIFVILILLVIFLWSFYKPIKYFGTCLLINGIIFVILGSLNNFFSQLVLSQVERLKFVISPFITIILTIWFKCGVLISFTGVFIIIFYIVINRIVINNNKTR